MGVVRCLARLPAAGQALPVDWYEKLSARGRSLVQSRGCSRAGAPAHPETYWAVNLRFGSTPKQWQSAPRVVMMSALNWGSTSSSIRFWLAVSRTGSSYRSMTCAGRNCTSRETTCPRKLRPPSAPRLRLQAGKGFHSCASRELHPHAPATPQCCKHQDLSECRRQAASPSGAAPGAAPSSSRP